MDDLARVFATLATATTNQALLGDPELRARLQTLEGRCIEICCDIPSITWHLTITNGAIDISQGRAVAPHVSVRGTALDLARWLSPVPPWSVSTPPAQVKIEGDDTLLLEILELLRDFKPDLESPLPKTLEEALEEMLDQTLGPDNAATLLGTAEMGLKGLQSLIEGVGFTVEDRVAGSFVQQDQLNSLLTGIDDLRLRVDRLAAKVSQREQTQQRANHK